MVKYGEQIFHITDIHNLKGISSSGCLACKTLIDKHRISFVDAAHHTIQARRALTRIPCGTGGYLHNYVPFSFAPRSPMLYTIHRGNVLHYNRGQRPMIHLVTMIPDVIAAGRRYVFTDSHPTKVAPRCTYYDDVGLLTNAVDWEVMKATRWNYASARRMAEFLVFGYLPWPCISAIGVIDESMKSAVETIIHSATHQPSVEVHRNWYY